jgi:redox-sensitive bicupin YhaK (pirin superfamily)
MSWLPDNPPAQGDTHACKALSQVIVPRARDIGGFEVRRALPSAQRQMVGPFIFFDQMGPAELLVGGGIDVRPHPHIGLATVTYLFEGEIFHRDSLGNALPIRPGAVNLMTAGRGIAHSERETGEARKHTRCVFGIQAWAALPRAHEEDAPAFVHHAETELPRIEGDGTFVRLILGEAYGKRSPAAFPQPSLYAEAVLSPGAALPLDPDYDERAIYIASGQIDVAGDRFEAGRLLVFRPGDRLTVRAFTDARLMLVAGEPMDGPRHIWWNFVSSSKERIEAAKSDWTNGRFGLIPGDDKEFIPLPA